MAILKDGGPFGGVNQAGVNSAGQLTVTLSGSTAPLPTNAAQETGGNLAGINTKLTTTANGLKVDGSGATQPVSGTFFQATQPVSAAALPLPTGAATAANQAAPGTAGSPSAQVFSVQGVAGGVAQPVSGTVTLAAGVAAIGSVSVSNFPATQPISASSLPLPTGASTSANQTTLGAQTTQLNDGSRTAVIKAASTAPAATDQALVVAVSPNTPALPVTGTFFQATQPVSIAATVNVALTTTVTSQTVGDSGFKATQATVTNTAAQLASTALTNRNSMSVANLGSVTVFLGGAGVTATTGFPVFPNTSLPFDASATAAVYAITSTGSAVVAILELAP